MSEDHDTVPSVKLKNDDRVPRVTVLVLMPTLKKISRDHTTAFVELTRSCRDHTHVLSGNTAEYLQQLGLVQDVDGAGRAIIHDNTRSIVLSAVEGEGPDMHLVWPIAGN